MVKGLWVLSQHAAVERVMLTAPPQLTSRVSPIPGRTRAIWQVDAQRRLHIALRHTVKLGV